MNGGRGKRLFLLALCGGFALMFAALGVWQVKRLQWKRDLIGRVEARVTATPVSPPRRADWPRLDAAAVEYRRVVLTGTFDQSKGTLVDALTERGAGYWLLVPLTTSHGVVLVNRGFVPRRWNVERSPTDETGYARVTGLLRLSEPDGRILRPNEPAADRWFSRDVTAIARARGLSDVAPFFVDAEANPADPGFPVGGLTVIHFRNHHMLYALTWFALAALALGGLVLVARSPHKRG